MNTNTNAPAKEKGKMGSLVKAFKPFYVPFFIAIVLLLISVICTILTPGSIRSLTNEISPVGKEAVDGKFVVDMANVGSIGMRIVLFIAVSFITSTISGFMLNTTIQKFSKGLRRDISRKINKLPLNYYDTTQTGDILSVITNDVDTLSTSLQNSVGMLVQSGVLLVGVLIAMFIACWQMALAVLCSLPVMLIIIGITFKVALPLFNQNQMVLADVNARVEENYSGHLIIKAFNAESRKIGEFREENNLLGKILYKSQGIGGMVEPAMSFVSYLTYAA